MMHAIWNGSLDFTMVQLGKISLPSTWCISVQKQTTQSSIPQMSKYHGSFRSWRQMMAFSASIGKSMEKTYSVHGIPAITTPQWTLQPFRAAISRSQHFSVILKLSTKAAIGTNRSSLIIWVEEHYILTYLSTRLSLIWMISVKPSWNRSRPIRLQHSQQAFRAG